MNHVETHSFSTYRGQYIKNLRRLGMTKKKSWIERMVKSGYIGVNKDTVASSTSELYWKSDWEQAYLKQIFAIIDTLEVAHPGNWDMHIQEHLNKYRNESNEKRYLYSLHPIIRYPKFIISNSDGEEAEIRDLIVALPLAKNPDFLDFTFEINIIMGTRYNFCYEHYTSRYLHSHLVSSSYPAGDILSFCLGEDDLQDIIMEISGNGFDENMFGLFISMLDNMVKWESLEGVPYNYIAEIVTKNEDNRISPTSSEISVLYRNTFRPWLQSESELPVNFVYNKGRYQIKKDDDYNQFVKKFIMTYERLIYLYLCKEKDGYYYSPKQSSQNDIPDLLESLQNYYEYSEPPFTYISGKKIKTQIRRTKFDETEDINTFNVHPKLLDYVATQLERELYEKAVISSAVEARAEISNA